jgi:hypothetical protein
VHFYLSAQHTWSHLLSVCLSCVFSASPVTTQLAPLRFSNNKGARKNLTPTDKEHIVKILSVQFLFCIFSVKVQFIESAHIISMHLWIFCTCVYLCSHHFQDHIHLVPPAVATLLTELDLLLHLTELESSPCSQIHMAPKRHHCVPSRQCPKDSHCFGFYCRGLVWPNLKFHTNKIMEYIFLWIWLPFSTVFWDASMLLQI